MPSFSSSKSRTSMMPTNIQLEDNLVLIEPPKKSQSKRQWTKTRTTSKSQPASTSAVSRPASKASEVQDPSPKHVTSKSRPKDSDAKAKDHKFRKDEPKKDSTKKASTGEVKAPTKHTKSHPTTQQSTNESKPAKNAPDVENQSATAVPAINIQPTEPPQISLKIIRIPWNGSKMKPVTVPLSQKPPSGSTDARTKELEAWLGHVPSIWTCFESDFCWKHRKLLAILTHTDLSKVSDEVLKTAVTPDNFMYACFKKQGPGDHRNKIVYEICKKEVYGDAYFFRWMPQQWRPDGRAILIDTEKDFAEQAHEGNFPAKLLRTLFEPGEGLGTKL